MGPALLQPGGPADEAPFVTGRLEETIHVRGRDLAPEDLERSVADSHPALAMMPGAAFAELHEGAETFVVVQELRAQQLSLAALLSIHAQAIERLIREHGVGPHELTLVKPGSIPRTPSGKLQRQRCRELWRQGALARCCLSPPLESAAQPPQQQR